MDLTGFTGGLRRHSINSPMARTPTPCRSSHSRCRTRSQRSQMPGALKVQGFQGSRRLGILSEKSLTVTADTACGGERRGKPLAWQVILQIPPPPPPPASCEFEALLARLALAVSKRRDRPFFQAARDLGPFGTRARFAAILPGGQPASIMSTRGTRNRPCSARRYFANC